MTHLDDILCAIAACGGSYDASGWDDGTIRSVLGSMNEFTSNTLAPTNAEADRLGCKLENGRVRMPPALVDAYTDYTGLGWHQLAIPVEIGGAGAPAEVELAGVELLAYANHSFQMVVGLVAGAIDVIRTFGTDAQRERFLPSLVSGQALATMCMTEPGAGSDLARITCKAQTDDTNVWRLKGEKIFVSGGDQDMSTTIIHLVLARSGSMEDGVKGLSLFACPAHLEDGTPNTIKPIRIEEKLGLHASPTCHLQFDNAHAELIGAPGGGLRSMFVLMDHTRLDVAIQGIAHATRAHELASAFARQRIQGNTSEGPATIDQHGDVERMLKCMDILALGSRAMVMRTASCLSDQALAGFLTPVCKVWCTEAGTRAADLGIQVLGGYGYLPEYGLEQIWRDARVARIYEGTNGILSMTLVNRLLATSQGRFRHAFEGEIQDAMNATNPLADEIAHLFFIWRRTTNELLSVRDRGRSANAYMQLTGSLFFLACWQRLISFGDTTTNRAQELTPIMKALLLPEAEMFAEQCLELAALSKLTAQSSE